MDDKWQISCRFKDKEVQRDSKMVPYKIIDRAGKPYVEVKVGGENKVRSSTNKPNLSFLAERLIDKLTSCMMASSHTCNRTKHS